MAALALAAPQAAASVFVVEQEGGTIHVTNLRPASGAYREILSEPIESMAQPGAFAAPPAPQVDDVSALVVRAASRHGLPEALLHAVIKVESNYNPQAVSPKGAIGLMQLMPGTARLLGVSDPFDPAANVDAGARYLRRMLDQFGDLSLALAAYNAGPGAVERHRRSVPPFAETRAYVPRVLALYRRLSGLS